MCPLTYLFMRTDNDSDLRVPDYQSIEHEAIVALSNNSWFVSTPNWQREITRERERERERQRGKRKVHKSVAENLYDNCQVIHIIFQFFSTWWYLHDFYLLWYLRKEVEERVCWGKCIYYIIALRVGSILILAVWSRVKVDFMSLLLHVATIACYGIHSYYIAYARHANTFKLITVSSRLNKIRKCHLRMG